MTALVEALQNIYKTYQMGDNISAEVELRSLLKSYPKNPDVLRLGALTALGVNQLVQADQRLANAAKLSGMTIEMTNTRGNIMKAAADWAGAEAAYNTVLNADPNYKPVYGNLLDLFVQSGQAKRVLSVLDTDHDFGEMGVYARTQALTNLGRYDDALNVIIKANPKSYKSEFLMQRIKVLANLGRLEEMQTSLRELSPQSIFAPDALMVAVNAYEMRGLRADALDTIAMTCANPDAIPKTLVKGTSLLRRMGNNHASQDLLQTAIHRFKKHPDILSEQANVALKEKDIELSCALYKQALSARPGDIGILMGYAQAALVAKRYDICQQMLQGAMTQAPNNQFLLALAASLQRVTGGSHKGLYDYDKFVRVYTLDPPEGYADIESFNAALKTALTDLHAYKNTPVNQSLRNGTQTDMDLSLVEHPVVQSFFKAIEAPIRNYMKLLGQDKQHPLIRRNRNDYRISGAWSVCLFEGGHHVNHVHPMGWLSSSYYVDVPSSVDAETHEGWLKFGEPALDLPECGPEKFIQPKPGRLVLFPSYMWHGTVPFTGKDTRLTLPFDVVPA